MPEHRELRVLADFLHVGAQAVNVWARPTPLAVNGELETDERGEVVYAEIFPPVTGAGVEEELRKVIITLDGEERGNYVSLSGIRATNMAPPKTYIRGAKLFSFGTPGSNNPLLNTTLKYKQNLTVACQAGPTVPITQNYRVRLWGVVYKASELPAAFGTMLFPASLTETNRNRTVFLNKQPIPVNADTWLTLPGGKDQGIPKINPFARYAYNLLATDGQQGDYQFRFTTGGVVEADENMYFEFDDKDAILVKSLGVKTAVNMARAGLRIAGDYHPKGMTTRVSLFPTTVGINELNFGHRFPFAPIADPDYDAIPKLAQPYLIWNEIGYPAIRDDGVGAAAINSVVICMTGIRLEMRS